MSKFVPEALRKAAAIYEERNALYGDNYKRFGQIFRILMFDNPAPVAGTDMFHYYNRMGVLVQLVSKITRYCQQFNAGGHADSLDDLAVYAMMLRELDTMGQETFQGLKPEDKSQMRDERLHQPEIDLR